MAMGPGTLSTGEDSFRAARTSLRSNQRTSAISSGSMRMSWLSACPWQPIMRDEGNGQGWEEW